MSEPDHIFLRPLPNLMRGDAPAAFPFFYIEPHKDDNIEARGGGITSHLGWPREDYVIPGGSRGR